MEGFCPVLTQKHEHDSKTDNRKAIVKSLNFDPNKLAYPKQVHSSKVISINKPGIIEETDGVISINKEIVLSIKVADCVPLFLGDKVSGHFGLVHSGWRGTANNISRRAVKRMKEVGSNVKNIKAMIGPAINQCCFEVGPEVSDQFDNSFSIAGKGDRQMLDLKSVIKHQLIDSGVKSENIIIDDDCTSCREDLYYSYRRDGKKSGRMIAIAGWR